MSKSPWRLLALVATPLLVVAAGVLYLLLPPWQTGEVAMPPDDATPELVVSAYLAALDAHDCDTADALTEDGLSSWCEDVVSLTRIDVRPHSVERPGWSGRSQDEQVAIVPAAFDLRWRPLRGDSSVVDAMSEWGSWDYLLVRGSPNDPWRIFSQGVA